MQKIRWAIWATGEIAEKFCKALRANPQDHEILCVLSRSQQKAEAFAKTFSIPFAYSDPQAMLGHAQVDIVYIATPNASHCDCALAALAAGKHVLCEKPLAANYSQTQRMISLAQEKRLFLMEAVWTHFFPAILKVRQWIEQGRIGRVLRVNASFGIRCNPDNWRMTSAEDSGSALQDLGIYCLTIASFGLGLCPEEIKSYALVEHGVDQMFTAMLKYSADQYAVIQGGFYAKEENRATIVGEKGFIVIDPYHLCPRGASLYDGTGSSDPLDVRCAESFYQDYAHGMAFEAAHVAQCLRQGKLQSDVIPHEKTLQYAKIMDSLRAEWGCAYVDDAHRQA